MRLKRITVSGFKSMADKLGLEFGEGVTCIVGPNGCGKSNISDAVRWVLGEQNPRDLRANKMQDLIFGGTTARKPEGMCEVRLLLDNEQGLLSLPFAEVEVSRRLYRSGDSEYLINKELVRLKDIADLFSNTGIGTDSYSLLEQGRVDGILKAKPIDRREIFEEAAGITKFRLRQEEALRKLKRTSQDLQRINDIVGELSRQVRSLKLQAGKAERYHALHGELHKLELVRVERQRAQLGERLEQGRAEHKRILELKASLEEQVRQGGMELETARGRVEQVNKQLLEFRARKAELESEIRRFDDQLSHCRAMETELLHQGERTRELLGTLSGERDETETALDSKQAIEARLRQKLADLEVEENLLASQEAEGRADCENAKSAAEEARRRLLESERSFESISKEIEGLARELAALEEREQRLQDAAAEASEDLSGIDGKFASVRAIHEDTQSDHAREESVKAELAKRVQDLEQAIEVHRAENERLRADRSRLNHRLESLRELQVQHEGHGEGVKQAFDRKHKGEAPFNCIEGLLIEKIRVRPGYEDAVESALSTWLESVICPGKTEAMAIVEALSSQRGGRVTCIPKAYSKSRRAEEEPANTALSPNRPAIEGALPASEVVEIQPEFADLIEPLLSKTLIVSNLRDLSRALDLLEEGWMAVTMQGEMALFPGFVSGGRAVTTGYLKRQSEIDEIERKVEEVEGNWKASEEELARLREARKIASDELKARETAIHDLVIRMAAKQEELQGLAQLRLKVEKSLDTARREIETLVGIRAGLVEKRIESDQIREALAGELGERESAFQEAVEEHSRIEQALQDLQAGHHRHRESVIALRKDHERCQAEIQQAKDRRAYLEDRVVQLRGEDEERERKIWETLDRKTHAEEALRGLFEKVDRVEQDLSELEAGLAQEQEKYHAIEEQANMVRGMLQMRAEEAQRVEMDNHRAAVEMESLERRLAEELQSDWETCLKTLEEMAEAPGGLEELSAAITSLRERIGKMGEINPLAVEEYAEQKERLDFLVRQQEDLERARTSLQKTLSEVKRSARKQFLVTFEQIRQNFNRTFRRIFGGGRADLILLDEADILQTGVEIVAQPPGKKLQSITLFSGGEKSMTAIALLFAIYHCKASPFCFLDEVDAALDDANVDRFARLLLDYRAQTQFIIVTHNKHTMAVADRLYGVTMDKPGISTVMSMEFERKSDYNLSPLPHVEDDPLPERDYDAALSAMEEDSLSLEGAQPTEDTDEVDSTESEQIELVEVE
jgi:chromosome segregation protein